MKIKDLSDQIYAAYPNELGKVPQQKIRLIVREALERIQAAVDATQDGALAVDGLGRFKVRQAEMDKNGETSSQRRVAFLPGRKAERDAADAGQAAG